MINHNEINQRLNEIQAEIQEEKATRLKKQEEEKQAARDKARAYVDNVRKQQGLEPEETPEEYRDRVLSVPGTFSDDHNTGAELYRKSNPVEEVKAAPTPKKTTPKKTTPVKKTENIVEKVVDKVEEKIEGDKTEKSA